MPVCNCPAAAAIATIPVVACPERVGQVQKLAFQRVFATGTTKNKITNPTLLASWSPFLAASDGTKMTVSPYVEAPVFEAGAARTTGGGNETLDGIERIVGANPTTFTGVFNAKSQKSIVPMKQLACENIGVILVSEGGQIAMLADDINAPTEYYPIPISAFFVGDKAPGGFEADDKNAITFKLQPNWSDKLVLITPSDFNPLEDWANPVVES